MLLRLILDILFFLTWGWLTFDFLAEGNGVIYSTIISFFMTFGGFFLLGIILGLITIKTKNKSSAIIQKINQKEILRIEDDLKITESSEEIACRFKDVKFPLWVIINNNQIKLFFKDVVHTDKSGIYKLFEPLKQNHIILKPGAIYGPKDVQEN